MGGFIAGGSRDEVELRQLHVTCNVHPPGFHPALIIMIVNRMLKVLMPKSNNFKEIFPRQIRQIRLNSFHLQCLPSVFHHNHNDDYQWVKSQF